MRKKRITISLSPEWFKWMDDEAGHRDQSYSELMEDALTAFEEKLVANFEKVLADAKRSIKRKRR